MLSAEVVESIYTIAPDDTVTSVDEGFRTFARQNGAPILADRVVGRVLWAFIAGSEVRRFYASLFERVRRTGEMVTLPFRCDAPDVRRLMAIEVAPLRAIPASEGFSGALQLRAFPLVEHPRPAAPSRLFAPETGHHGASASDGPTTAPTSPTLRMCSWCKRIESGGWREVEEVLEEGRAMAEGTVPPVVHVVCPDCDRYLREGS